MMRITTINSLSVKPFLLSIFLSEDFEKLRYSLLSMPYLTKWPSILKLCV